MKTPCPHLSVAFLFSTGWFMTMLTLAGVVAAQDQPTSLWTRPGNDWPRFLGVGTDGTSTETGILQDWSQGKLKVLWSLDTGEGYGMGVTAAGRYFHFGKYPKHAILKCLNAETGKLRWEFKYASNYSDLYNYDSGPRASPVVDGNRVYIFGVEGMLHCLDVATGNMIWKVDTEKRFGVIQNFFGVGSSPLIYQDKLLVMVGGSPESSKGVPPGRLNQVKPNNSGVVAFDKLTGKVIYQTIDDLASYSSIRLMPSAKRPLALAWMRNKLHAFDPENGKVQFSYPYRARKLESVNAATPLTFDNKILLTESYQLGGTLLDARTNSLQTIWSDNGIRKKSLASHWTTPVVDGDYVYGCSGEKPSTAEMRCVNWKTGEVKWGKRGFGRGSFLKIDGHLILFGEWGQLVLLKLDSEQFNEVTRYAGTDLNLGSPSWPAPIVSHGLLYVRGTRKLVCLDLIPKQ